MKIPVAIEYEKQRQDIESWTKIILHKDGKFYHAYDQSAFLIKTYVCTEAFQEARGDNSILRAQFYTPKKGSYAMLGFPVESLSKYIPEYEDVRAMEEGDDLEITISLPQEETVESLQEAFEKWCGELPVKEPNKGAGKNALKGVSQAAILQRSGLFQIIAKVMAYPVEKSTPTENMEFISDLKREVAGLL